MGKNSFKLNHKPARLIAVRMAVLAIVVALSFSGTLGQAYASGYYDDPPQNITVKFNVNGGKSLKTKSITFDLDGYQEIKLPCPVSSVPGKVFAGWYVRTASGSEERIVSGYSNPNGTEIRTYCYDKNLSGTLTLVAHYAPTPTNPSKGGGKVNIKVKKWKIKSKVNIDVDQTRLTKSGPQTVKYDAKIGTATLSKAPKKNMVLATWKFTDRPYENSPVHHIVLYKGKKTADVYARLTIDKPGSKKYGKKTKKTGYFKFNDFSCLCREHYCPMVANEKAGYLGPMFTVPNGNAEVVFQLAFYGKNLSIFGLAKPGSSINGPTINKKITYVIRNKKQSLGGALSTKSPYYKQAKKMVGSYSDSCNNTAYKLVTAVSKNGSSIHSGLNLSVKQARVGDVLDQDGHMSVYLGGKQSLHGDVSSHKTWIGRSEIRTTYYAWRPYYSIFYK